MLLTYLYKKRVTEKSSYFSKKCVPKKKKHTSEHGASDSLLKYRGMG